MGKPARVLFDAAARDDQHKYSDRSLRGTSRGSSRAASGGPPPLLGRVGQAGLLFRGSCYTLGTSPGNGGETHDNLLVFDGVVFDGARGSEEAVDS